MVYAGPRKGMESAFLSSSASMSACIFAASNEKGSLTRSGVDATLLLALVIISRCVWVEVRFFSRF